MTLGFTGDVMLGRLVNKSVGQVGYAHPWGNVLPLMQTHDLNIINLETALTTSERRVPKVFNFKAEPDRVRCLTEARIDIATLANNHVLDFDVAGLTETINVLDEAGIQHTGAGANSEAAKQPVIVNRNNVRIGVIGITDNEARWKAGPDKPGTNFVRTGDAGEVKNQIQQIRNEVDLLILSIHWGPNMLEFPSSKFIHFAHNLIDNGVDIFHGHSAHVFQGVEVYNGKLIMYDTGEFIDDYAVDYYLRNDYSFLFEVELYEKSLQKLILTPVYIHQMQVNRATGQDYRNIVQLFKKRSAVFNTIFTEEAGKLHIPIAS